MSVKEVTLECTASNCDLGQSGERYKTPKLEVVYAMEMLRFHLQQNHDQGQVGNQRRQDPGDGCFTKPEKTRRPSLQKGISEDRFLTFERQWARYKKSTGMQDESSYWRAVVKSWETSWIIFTELNSTRKLKQTLCPR